MKKSDLDLLTERQLALALKSEPETWTPDCLAPERMFALVERSLPEAEAVSQMAHVALCSRCRREYAETAELMQLASEVNALEAQAEAKPAAAGAAPVVAAPVERPPAPAAAQKPSFTAWLRMALSPGLGFGLGATVAGIALFFVLAVPARKQSDRLAADLKARETQIAQAEQEKQQLAQALDASQREKHNASTLTEKISRLNEENKRQNVQIARLSELEAEMPLPTAAWRLPKELSQVRGKPGTANTTFGIALLQPVNTAIQETKPVLECRPVAGVTNFQISLEREDSTEAVPALKRLSPTRWQVEAPLLPGVVYKWAVTAQQGNRSLRSPLAKFYVLTEADRHTVEAARQKYAGNPLALGAVYARMGMQAEAAQQFRAALKANPKQPVAARWLQEIEPHQADGIEIPR